MTTKEEWEQMEEKKDHITNNMVDFEMNLSKQFNA